MFNHKARACGQGVELTLQWRHNERNGVSNHRRLDCLLLGEFLTQRDSNMENVSIWWLQIVDLDLLSWAYPSPRPQKNGMARVTTSFDILTGKWSSPVCYIHEIGDVTAEWFRGYRPRSRVMGGYGGSWEKCSKIACKKSPILSRPQWVQWSTAEGYNKTSVFDTDLIKLTGILQA